MNKLSKLALFAFFLCITGTISAQSYVEETSTTFDKRSMSAVMVRIDAPRDAVEDKWDEFWDDKYDVDIDKKDKDRNQITMVAEQVSIPAVSDKNFDLMTKVADSGDGSTVYMGVSFGYDVEASNTQYTSSYQAAKAIMRDFQTYFYDKYFGDQLAELNDELKDVRDDREDASEDQQKSKKKIEKWQKKIADYEEKIQDERDDIGEEIVTEQDKAEKVAELEQRIREIEQMKSRYMGGR
ncbi:MAG: hypothetical protein WBA17_06870 [Saprospiraceae bacterium]